MRSIRLAMRGTRPGKLLIGFLTFAGGLVSSALIAHFSHVFAGQLHGWDAWSVTVVGVCFLAVCLTLLYLAAQLNELQSQQRLTIRYFDRETGLGRREVLGLIEDMDHDSEYTALSYYGSPYGGMGNHVGEQFRRQMLRTITTKLDNCRYRRIVQIDPNARLADLIDKPHSDHFMSVIHIRDEGLHSQTLQVHRVPVRYPLSFLIIKNSRGAKCLVLDIFERPPGAEAASALRVIGSLLINDPDERVIGSFEGLFRTLENSPDFRVITADELAQPPASIRQETMPPSSARS
jgi:hypothetical protein